MEKQRCRSGIDSQESMAEAIKFLQLMEGYSLSHNLSIPDALIAATALEHMLELYTLNTKDFQFIPGLMLYHPQSY